MMQTLCRFFPCICKCTKLCACGPKIHTCTNYQIRLFKGKELTPSKLVKRYGQSSPISDPENKGARQGGVNFDTIGSWNNRLEMPIMMAESIKKGKLIPEIPLDRVGVATLLGRRKVNEDRYGYGVF